MIAFPLPTRHPTPAAAPPENAPPIIAPPIQCPTTDPQLI